MIALSSLRKQKNFSFNIIHGYKL